LRIREINFKTDTAWTPARPDRRRDPEKTDPRRPTYASHIKRSSIPRPPSQDVGRFARRHQTPELIWKGKYNEDGKRAAPLRVALPFQTVETVNESVQERQRSLDLFGSGRDAEWRNRLIWGDKKYVLPALLEEFAGKVDLVYLDPPFATGQDFSLPVQVGGEQFTKQPSLIEVKAYRDTWGGGLDSYLEWFYGTALFLHQLLAETGSFYVHLDPGVSHLVKIVLDEVFSPENFRNEITWKRTGAHSGANRYGPAHDSILFYTRSSQYTWNVPYLEYDESHLKKFKHVDADGQKFSDEALTGPGRRSADSASAQEWGGYDPTAAGRHWQPASYGYDKYRELTGEDLAQYPLLERLDRLDQVGLIFWPAGGGRIPRLKRYLDDQQGGPAQDVWTDVDVINSRAAERVGYPTQKPQALLERVIRASSKEDDLVLDCFAGSGTTAVAAECLNRRWIAADLGRFAVHTIRKRLLSIAGVKPFVVQNLGKYITIKTFAKALRGLVVEELTPSLEGEGRKLSGLPPFPFSRPTFAASKTIFNLVAADNEFEREFARFLEDASDVRAFAKLPSRFGFAIEYTDNASNLRYYEPDFIAVDLADVHHLIETKGREDIDVAHKDRAARIWCDNATLLTDTPWRYLKVPQADFAKLQATDLAELVLIFDL
jgi:DNA modification methylase